VAAIDEDGADCNYMAEIAAILDGGHTRCADSGVPWSG
jgi:hypothetical protein